MKGPLATGPWPATAAELEQAQVELSLLAARTPPWDAGAPQRLVIAAAFVCFPRARHGPGDTGDPAWVGAVVVVGGEVVRRAQLRGRAAGPYVPGLLALREGALLEAGVNALDRRPDVVVVDATGLDHPRGAGLALHLGARLGLPTVGVTDRPLVAIAGQPGSRRGDSSPLVLDGEVVGMVVRTTAQARPLCVHAAWRTTPSTAVAVVMAAPAPRVRTPLPLREARRIARSARALDESAGRG